ncbi:MAG TPA: Hsp20/alpha crystallin family protein [Actinomycetota bacterium]|nr:Hsp20/alpha crystallin family protein [Actinomycetota bacterium]
MLRKWQPFDAFERDVQEIRRTFGDFGTALLNNQQERTWAPALDIFMRDNAVHVRVELPGIDPNRDVDIEVSDGVLTVSGERRHEQVAEEEGYWRREISHGTFQRSIALPQGVDPSQVKATYDAGILHLVVPLPVKQSSKVRVEVGTVSATSGEVGSGGREFAEVGSRASSQNQSN